MHDKDTWSGRACVALAAIIAASCGGGDSQAPVSDDDSAVTRAAVEPLDLSEADPSRVDAHERRSIAAADPSMAPDEVRYLVTLNPAVVADEAARTASVLSARSGGTSRTAAAVRALAASTVQGLDVRVQQHYEHALQGYAVAVPVDRAPALLARLRTQAAVMAVELDRLVRLEAPVVSAASALPGIDAQRLWGLDRIDQRALPLDARYTAPTTGQGVAAYIIDSGIAPHAEFGTRLGTGTSFVADGRSATDDCNGHGTHVAGTVGGATHGVATAVTLVPVRVLGCDGSGTGSAILNGVEWVLAHAQRPAVVNFSIGMSGVSPAIDEAIEKLGRNGITPVVAAGNSAQDACQASPARTPGAVTVGAIDMSDTKASFSNFGACLDLFAPGVMILSANRLNPTDFVYKSGTSMAAPHVTGAAALWLAANPEATPAQVTQHLLAQASPVGVKFAGAFSPSKVLYVGAEAGTPPVPADAVRVSALTVRPAVQSSTAWSATAVVAVRNAQGQAVPKVTASIAASSQRKALSCSTDATGTCSVTVAGLSRANVSRVSFAVTDLKGSNLRYWSAANAVQVGTSDVAPSAAVHVQALTPLTPVIGRTYWQARAAVSLRNVSGYPLTGLKVSALAVPGNQTLTCTTSSSGTCTLTGPRLGLGLTSTTFEVRAVASGADRYQAELNLASRLTLTR